MVGQLGAGSAPRYRAGAPWRKSSREEAVMGGVEDSCAYAARPLSSTPPPTSWRALGDSRPRPSRPDVEQPARRPALGPSSPRRGRRLGAGGRAQGRRFSCGMALVPPPRWEILWSEASGRGLARCGPAAGNGFVHVGVLRFSHGIRGGLQISHVCHRCPGMLLLHWHSEGRFRCHCGAGRPKCGAGIHGHVAATRNSRNIVNGWAWAGWQDCLTGEF